MEGPKLKHTESSCAVILQACTELCRSNETERQNFNYISAGMDCSKNKFKNQSVCIVSSQDTAIAVRQF